VIVSSLIRLWSQQWMA